MQKKKNILGEIKDSFNQFFSHIGDFWTPWVLLLGMLIIAPFCEREIAAICLYVLGILFLILLITRPMFIIHSLIGTRGDIRTFFMVFLLINAIFAGIYFFAFFQYAGITYEINQPHVEFNLFEKGCNGPDTATVSPKDVSLPHTCDDNPQFYYRTRFGWVLRNTFLTSLMQEPTDFFSIANTYTGPIQDRNDLNFTMSNAFHWFLIFHILISWILLGVFISLIYQRFRNS